MKDLTKSQREKLPLYKDKWQAIGRSTAPMDYVGAIMHASDVYKNAGLPLPEFLRAPCPVTGGALFAWLSEEDTLLERLISADNDSLLHPPEKIAPSHSWNKEAGIVAFVEGIRLISERLHEPLGSNSQIVSFFEKEMERYVDNPKSEVGEAVRKYGFAFQNVPVEYIKRDFGDLLKKEIGEHWDTLIGKVRDSVRYAAYGSHDAHWLLFYDFFLEVLEMKDCESLLPLMGMAKSCGWWLPYDNICIIQDRHSVLQYAEGAEKENLHRTDGPAIMYPSGWGVYVYNGLRVPQRLSYAFTDPQSITPDQINDEDNAELSRVLLAQLGTERYLEKSSAVKLDESQQHGVTLYGVETRHGDQRITLSVCPSTGREYAQFVLPSTKTVNDALRWRFGLPQGVEYNPVEEA